MVHFTGAKVHETKFSRAGIFFVAQPKYFGFFLFFSLKKVEIVTVNHNAKRKFLCRSDPL